MKSKKKTAQTPTVWDRYLDSLQRATVAPLQVKLQIPKPA